MMVTTVSYGRVRGKATQYPYFQACLYEYRPRKKDKVMTARFVSTIGNTYRSYDKALKEASEYATVHNIEYKDNIRQGRCLVSACIH